MRAKTNSKKQLTLPKSVAGAVRAKLAKIELNEKDIASAVAWTRKPDRKAKK
jgi:hypothetical protein